MIYEEKRLFLLVFRYFTKLVAFEAVPLDLWRWMLNQLIIVKGMIFKAFLQSEFKKDIQIFM